MHHETTDFHNWLNTFTLEYLMQVSVNGPCPEEFDFEKATASWVTKEKEGSNSDYAIFLQQNLCMVNHVLWAALEL